MTTETYARFDNKIGPQNLLGLVKNTAPFFFAEPVPLTAGKALREYCADPLGWKKILQAAADFQPPEDAVSDGDWLDYFALCLAAHHGTVSTFVPTDVDTKIRGHLWRERPSPTLLREMLSLALAARCWDTRVVTIKGVETAHGFVCGHDGEQLGVWSGGLGALLRVGETAAAEEAADTIHAELLREQQGFTWLVQQRDRELDVLRVAAMITHNAGDVDQGISFWNKGEQYASYSRRFGRLAHEGNERYGGAFAKAAVLYKELLAQDGHRNYPLREVKELRVSLDLILPISPFLDAWGERIATTRHLDDAGRATVLTALLLGCKKIKNQQGYYRAIAGMQNALGGRFNSILAEVPTSIRGVMKEPETRRLTSVSRTSFESSYKKRTAALLASLR